MLHIITYNTFSEPNNYKHRHDRINKKLLSFDSDIICLQEVATTYSKSLLNSTFDNHTIIFSSDNYSNNKISYLIPFFIFIVSYCIYRFNKPLSIILCVIAIVCIPVVMRFIFEYIMRLVFYHSYNIHIDKINTTGLCLILNKSKFRNIRVLRDKQFDNHSYQLEYNILKFIFNINIPKPGYILILVTDNNGKQLLVCNCHLSLGLYNNKKISQIQEIFNDIDKCSEYDNVIICGDFNSNKDSEEIQYIQNTGYKSIHDDITWDPEYNSYCNYEKENTQLDYIFIKGKVTDICTRTIMNEKSILSDHYGIMASVVIES